MKVDGNARSYDYEIPPRLKIAAQILAGLLPHIPGDKKSKARKALDYADDLIAEHNKDQEEKESGDHE